MQLLARAHRALHHAAELAGHGHFDLPHDLHGAVVFTAAVALTLLAAHGEH